MICLNFIADRGFKLEEEFGEDQGKRLGSHQAVGLAEQLGDLYCKVGCYSKALEAYQAQVRNILMFTSAPNIHSISTSPQSKFIHIIENHHN